MARSRRRPAQQSLDSLLDTMANVVGILVLLLAATQIGVGEAVERIRSLGAAPTEEAMGEARDRAAALGERLASLRDEWAGVSARAERVERALGERGLEAEALPGRVAALAERRRRLSGEVDDARARLARIEVEVEEARSGALARDRVVRLPDPRPPPDGAREALFFVRYGRLVPVDREALFRSLERGWRAAVGAEPWELEVPAQDVPRVVEHFEREVVGWGPFRWRVDRRSATALEARLTWARRDAGEAPAELELPRSAFRRRLERLDPEQRYLRFYVWGGSFEAYLEARRLAEEAGFAVGWRPFPDELDPVVGPSLERPERVD